MEGVENERKTLDAILFGVLFSLWAHGYNLFGLFGARMNLVFREGRLTMAAGPGPPSGFVRNAANATSQVLLRQHKAYLSSTRLPPLALRAPIV